MLIYADEYPTICFITRTISHLKNKFERDETDSGKGSPASITPFVTQPVDNKTVIAVQNKKKETSGA